MNDIDPKRETETLWREFHERLRAFVSRRGVRPTDVEDILQEVFLRIHRGLDTVRTTERLPAWIFQITRNVLLDHFRSSKRLVRVEPSDFDDLEQVDHRHGERQGLTELSACLEPMIAALGPIYREALELTDLKGMTQAEAAHQSGLTISGMKSRVQRGRQELRSMLLECCRVELDRRGSIIDYSVRDITKSPCGSCAPGLKEC